MPIRTDPPRCCQLGIDLYRKRNAWLEEYRRRRSAGQKDTSVWALKDGDEHPVVLWCVVGPCSIFTETRMACRRGFELTKQMAYQN